MLLARATAKDEHGGPSVAKQPAAGRVARKNVLAANFKVKDSI
jgi:hypothetical protein